MQSDKLYGEFTAKGFKYDHRKAPFIDIPDLTGFKLKPYVSVHTP
jgi:large subunit ribosomal protein L41